MAILQAATFHYQFTHHICLFLYLFGFGDFIVLKKKKKKNQRLRVKVQLVLPFDPFLDPNFITIYTAVFCSVLIQRSGSLRHCLLVVDAVDSSNLTCLSVT